MGGLRSDYDYLQVWGSRALAVFDFGVASSLSLSGADITQINDLSGRNNHLTSTAGNRPTFNATDADFAGQPTGQGNGISQTLRRAAMAYGAAQPTFTQIVVTRTIGIAGWVCSAVNVCGFQTFAGGVTQSVVLGTVATSAVDFRTRARCAMVLAPGGTYERIVDRVPNAPVAYVGSIGNGAQSTLFSAVAPSAYCSCKIAFYALISGALTAAEVLDWQNYASARWGVL